MAISDHLGQMLLIRKPCNLISKTQPQSIINCRSFDEFNILMFRNVLNSFTCKSMDMNFTDYYNRVREAFNIHFPPKIKKLKSVKNFKDADTKTAWSNLRQTQNFGKENKSNVNNLSHYKKQVKRLKKTYRDLVVKKKTDLVRDVLKNSSNHMGYCELQYKCG